jgi:UDP-glucose 4-epimerase
MILVTGGLGFIGSHIVVELLNNNYNVIVIDNLSNSKISVKNKIETITNKTFELFIFDICDVSLLEDIFIKYKISTIIHLAGLKSVNESIRNPLLYYNKNIISTLNLLKMVDKYNIIKFIFSSSATVYGTPTEIPLFENSQTGLNITNPYGKTKYMIEEIIKDYYINNNICKFIILRYFNPVGAHKSGLIGEDPNDIPNNLMPYILKVATNKYDKLSIYGNDYNTRDGTCIRDFIHVVDLAKAHVASINYNNLILETFNVGTGKGTTVLELVHTFINVNDVNVLYQFTDRRDGDIESNYANVDKANNLLNWKAEYSIEDMCRDAYNYAKNN